MAIVMFCQGLGAAVFVIIANAVFTNSLRHFLQQQAAHISVAPDVVINAGARGIRQLGLDHDQLAIVLQSYAQGIDNVMYVGIGVACAACAFAFGLPWLDIRAEKELSKIAGTPPAKEKDLEVGSA